MKQSFLVMCLLPFRSFGNSAPMVRRKSSAHGCTPGPPRIAITRPKSSLVFLGAVRKTRKCISALTQFAELINSVSYIPPPLSALEALGIKFPGKERLLVVAATFQAYHVAKFGHTGNASRSRSTLRAAFEAAALASGLAFRAGQCPPLDV